MFGCMLTFWIQKHIIPTTIDQNLKNKNKDKNKKTKTRGTLKTRVERLCIQHCAGLLWDSRRMQWKNIYIVSHVLLHNLLYDYWLLSEISPLPL